jgi:hypothetical protein
MALSFPTGPAPGAVYAAPNGVNYTWDSTAGVWTSSGSSSPPQIVAWVNFNGISAGINGSYNVSSITKFSAGNYQVNFATALSSSVYASPISSASSGVSTTNSPTLYTTTTLGIDIQQFGAGPVDRGIVNMAAII